MVDQMSSPAKGATASIEDMQQSMDSTGTSATSLSKHLKTAETASSSIRDEFKAAGDTISAAGDKIHSVGSKLDSHITKPALIAGSALSTLILAKGFARLTGIDDARAKLLGLGHTVESVTAILDSALDAVRGTSYGMDAAATTAAGAVAAGVGLGAELTRYLSLTADAAAIAGIEMSEMGQIMNKVQTSGKAMTQNLEQLSNRGLPIYQWLAKEAGVAADEVKALAADGKISTEIFLAAIENNIGGAAKKMGEASFTASIKNIGASLSRIGANFLDAGGSGGGFFSTLKPLISEFNDSLGVLEDKAKDLGVRFGKAFTDVIGKVQEMRDKFSGLDPPIQEVIKKGVLIGGAFLLGIGPVLKIVGTAVSGFGGLVTAVGFVLSPMGLLIAIVLALAGVFGFLMVRNTAFREKVFEVWSGVQDKISSVVDNLKPKISTMFDSAGASLGNLAPQVEGVFGSVVTAAQGAASSMRPAFSAMFETAVPIVQNLWNAIKGFFDGLKSGLGITSSVGDFGTIFTIILGQIFPPLKLLLFMFKNFAPELQTLVSTLSAQLVPLFTTLGSTIGGVVAAVLPALQSVMASLLPVIGQLISSLTEIIGAVLPVVIDLINQLLPFVVQLAEMIGEVVSAVAPMIAQLVSALLPVLTNIIQVVMNVVTSVMPAMIAIIGVIMSVIRALIPVITSIIQVVVNVISAVMAIINPIISFIGLVISAIMAVITPIITFIAGVISIIVEVIGTIIGIVADIFATVSGIVTGVWTSISSTVSGVITGISGTISSITGTVGTVFNGIFTTISTTIGNARDAVGSAIAAIKGFFNFSWSLPSLKLPRISMSGGFSLAPPSVPSFGISWHAKGGIMTKPTAFATSGNMIHAGGEAGPEAILPLALLWDKMQSIFNGIFEKDEPKPNPVSVGADITKTILSNKTTTKERVAESKSTHEVKKGTTIHTININIEKIESYEKLQKLLDEISDAQNGTDEPLLD